MTVAEIQGHLEELYGAEVSPSLISDVTDAVLDQVRAWQCRLVAGVYPNLYLEALMVRVRDNRVIRNKAVYLAPGVNLEGDKELLGLLLSPHEGAKFWPQVLTELKNRGLKEVLIACVDGLSGFPEALEAVFPHAQVQMQHPSCLKGLDTYRLASTGFNRNLVPVRLVSLNHSSSIWEKGC